MKWMLRNLSFFFPVLLAFNPPLSNLPLDLAGVVVDARDAGRSTCLVQLRPGPKTTGPLHPGENAFEMAEIRHIGSRGVIVRNVLTNRLECLAFPKDRPAPSPAPPAPPFPRLIPLGPDKIEAEIPEEAIRYYTGNLAEILNSASAIPLLKNGRDGGQTIEGFEIGRIKSGGIVERLGFRDGDVILAVGGEPLTSLESAIKFVRRAATMTRAELTVRRGGRKLTLIFRRK
jgi:type II secretory pathway component PulC